MSHYVGALDQGTSSTRFVVFDQAGRPIAIDQREHRQVYPEPSTGWSPEPGCARPGWGIMGRMTGLHGLPRSVDVLIVGGGATGAGILRDLARRGLGCLLVDKGDLARAVIDRVLRIDRRAPLPRFSGRTLRARLGRHRHTRFGP
jgi:hypothetical protein